MEIGGTLATVLGIATVVATGLIALQQGTVRTLRETAADLRAQNGDLKERRVEAEASIARLTQEREVLASVVTGEVHLTQLESQLDAHHRESMAMLSRVVDAIEGKT